jgi:putative secretion ATPase (PEP-CTERM system associated)
MYETFYNLTGKPFQLNPDPGFYFASKGHNRAYSYLKYGVYQGEGFIVLTGEIGAGKTTMVRALMADLDSSLIVAAQLISTQLEADDLLQAVSAAFGLAIKGLSKAEMLDQFETFLTKVTSEGRRALLVVDEAQNLSPGAMEELRMLSNFQLGTRAMLQSFLVGQPELREILRASTMTQLRQRVIASYHLGPMDKDETRAYVLHRLDCVGWKGDPSISAKVFERLFEITGGVPRIINAVCDRLLLRASLDDKHALDGAEIDETIKEMREEFGADTLRLDQPNLRDGRIGVRPIATAALAVRLERIEKSVAQAIDLLQQLSGQESGPAKATVSERRPRFGARPDRS